jgi:ABC-type multidrug transport system ATPase subunit
MTESMLQSLMKLFALLATINVEASKIFSRNFVESYLKGQFSPKMVERSISIFDKFLEDLDTVRGKNDQKRIAMISVKILMICNKINSELHLKGKFMILFSIIQFSKHFQAHSSSGDEYTKAIQDAISTISEALLINRSEFINSKTFINGRFPKVPDKSAMLVVSGLRNFTFSNIQHMYKPELRGQFFFLRIRQAELYIFYYLGNEVVELGGKNVFPNHIYVLPRGAALKTEQMSPLYFSDIVNAFRRDTNYPKITYFAEEIEYLYPGSDNGIHELSMTFHAGEMVGIMGGSGTGKSTLINVLNGSVPPDKGRITINGSPLDPADEAQEGLLGFVPQDDMLIEELTVYENLYFNARLCLGNMEEVEILKRIDKVLNNLGLFYIKDLKVGSPTNKSISGGQRKRLNIALELIRDSYVLFVDEPTSGLSSTDSDNVLTLLKDQTLAGKIVVINIHQPSSDMFKQFDKLLLLDKGGYPVYYGNPLEAIAYLKSVAERADAAEIECAACGNIHTDDLLNIIEARKVNEFGEYTNERLFSPREWYRLYREKFMPEPMEPEQIELPEIHFKIPGAISQFLIYSYRNILSKIADRQFVILSMVIAPLLALILGYFTKYPGGGEDGAPRYIFSLNENIPAYIFMAVIVSLFIGMIISAEEIIRDRKIRNREAFLNLSKYAYFNSKIVFLFALSALQMFVFVLIANHILEIRGLNLSYWLILFSTSCFAVMLGLNISAGLKSVISIYIVIPFVLVPLILLSGVIVKYDKLHPTAAGIEYVPPAGNLMASRWAYEALVVNQFRNNSYEQHFFETDRELANVQYNINFLIPRLLNHLNDLQEHIDHHRPDQAERELRILNNSLAEIQVRPSELKEIMAVKADVQLTRQFLMQWRDYLVERSHDLRQQKDAIISNLTGSGTDVAALKRRYHNEWVADLVTNSNELHKIVLSEGKLIRKDTPVFHAPDSGFGRAHFFASVKKIGDTEIDTVKFNVMILWLMTLILYFVLRYDLLRKTISLFEGPGKRF